MSFKRYWLFGGDNYYPSGGLYDFKKTFSTDQEAKDFALLQGYEWFQIFDSLEIRFSYFERVFVKYEIQLKEWNEILVEKND